MNKFFRNLGRYPLLVCMFILLLAAPFVREVFEPRFNSNYDFYFERDDAVLREYEKFVKDFKVSEQIYLILEVDRLFTNQALEAVSKTTKAIQNLDKVRGVTSLTNFRSVIEKNGSLEFETLIPATFDLLDEQLNEVRERVARDNWVQGKLVYKEGRYTSIIVDLKEMKTVAEKTEIVAQIHEKVRSNFPSSLGKYYLLGTPPAEAALEETLRVDHTQFQLYMPVVVTLLVVLLVRNIFASMILVANVFLTAGWVIGLMYHTGEALNPVTTLIMPTLIATGIAEGIHIVTHFLDIVKEEGRSYKEAILKSMREMWLPTIMTGMTSIVGYMSFLSSDIFPVKMMGVYMTVGLAIALVMTLVFIPALFLGLAPIFQRFSRKSHLRPTPPSSEHRSKESIPAPQPPMNSFEKLSRWILTYPKTMTALVLSASSALIFGMTHLKIDTNLETFLPENGEIRKNIDYIEKNVGNQTRYEVVLTMRDDHDDFANPKLLAQVENFREIVANHFASRGEVDSSWSAYDLLKVVHRSINDQDELPKDRSGILELIELADQDLMTQMITPSMRAVRVSFLGKFKESSQKLEFIRTVEQTAQLVFADRVRASTVSIPMLYFWVGERVFQTQVSSFTTAFIPIFLMMTIIGRSFLMGVISMLPNILPIFALFGIMGWMGIPLDTATAMIASVVIGIAVDDTIHFLHRYRTLTRAGYGRIDSIAKTFAHCGKASLFTSTIVALGFLGLVTSSLNPLKMFGALTALAMLIGVLCEIFVLPLALYFLDWKTPRHTSAVTLHIQTLKAQEKLQDRLSQERRSS